MPFLDEAPLALAESEAIVLGALESLLFELKSTLQEGDTKNLDSHVIHVQSCMGSSLTRECLHTMLSPRKAIEIDAVSPVRLEPLIPSSSARYMICMLQGLSRR